MLLLQEIKRTQPELLTHMSAHYSQPKGFVGRNICYSILYDGKIYGSIVGGSATRFLPGRQNFLQNNNIECGLNNIVNNIFFHVNPKENGYPIRNFTTEVLKLFRKTIKIRWEDKYQNEVKLFETLVELPRSGHIYQRDKWLCVGETKGFTCKRTAGKGTDSWSGKRVWDTQNLRPKLVFLRTVGD